VGHTQWHNRAHDRVGHVFQGRFKAIVVQRESYLLVTGCMLAFQYRNQVACLLQPNRRDA